MGENLAGWDGGFGSDGAISVNMWYDENKVYNYNLNKFQFSAGHFSQLVNKLNKV